MNKPAHAGEFQAIYDAVLRKQRTEFGAPSATVEALMFSLRERGSAALTEAGTQRRLSEMSPAQVR